MWIYLFDIIMSAMDVAPPGSVKDKLCACLEGRGHCNSFCGAELGLRYIGRLAVGSLISRSHSYLACKNCSPAQQDRPSTDRATLEKFLVSKIAST